MTLNSYRNPELRDRRSASVRHPLSTVLGVVVGVFLLLVPVGLVVRQSDRVQLRTAQVPGGFVDAAALVPATASTPAPASEAPSSEVTTDASAPPPTRRSTSTSRPKLVPKTKPTTTTTRRTTMRPTTTAAPTTAKPTTTASKPTTTTLPPTTTTAPPVVYQPAQSEAIIRQVWPDDLDDQAVSLATRESALRNTASNYCCYGLFQINFDAHAAWLASVGVTRPDQLFDPLVNAQVALGLYQREGWAPWSG